jgi:predicted DNA-binding transcriptional regulator YafY
MSKVEALSRLSLIVQRLRKKPSSFQEIDEYLKTESEIQDKRFTVSKRTFKRDIDDILRMYNIEIEYDPSANVYRIVHDGQSDIHNRMLEAYSTFNALSVSESLSQYIHFEKRKPQGLEHIYGILHAIKNHRVIEFQYEKFSEEQPSGRVIEPYALKEFKSRWYVIGKKQGEGAIRTYGLDRIAELDIKRQTFEYPADFNVDDLFKYSFGIIGSDDKMPENIILSFDPEQGKYIRTFPLHTSQKELINDDKEYRVSLNLAITYDLIMELLSHGRDLVVIEPLSLREKMVEIMEEAVRQYKK